VLRRYSLDELPQLVNVVRGEMSLVGPRPPLPSEVDRYESDAVRRLRVRPGMTGLWQVSGRSDLSWVESVRLDLWYVDNWSLALDAQILLRTAGRRRAWAGGLLMRAHGGDHTTPDPARGGTHRPTGPGGGPLRSPGGPGQGSDPS
jgi:hypothetical protein